MIARRFFVKPVWLFLFMLKKEIPQRKLDSYFNYYSENPSTQTGTIINGSLAFAMYFGLLGLAWSIPFPHINFLGRYNNYFNWASFVIAFSIYYYSRLSPIMSYLMLFLTLIFTYLIAELQLHYAGNNPILIQLYLLILIICAIARYVTYKIAGKNSILKMELLFVLIGPVWVLHFLLKKWKVKY